MADIPIGVVTISDRASRGVYEDKGGPGIEAALKELLATPWRPERRIVPDERPAIEAALIALADEARCSLILTTGGTGPAPRDVTPEATEAVCDRMLPGFGELMRLKSLAEVPTAILSRQVAGTRGSSLIINLPGKPAAIRTCLDAVFAAVPYCIDLIGGARLETNPEVLHGLPTQGVKAGATYRIVRSREVELLRRDFAFSSARTAIIGEWSFLHRLTKSDESVERWGAYVGRSDRRAGDRCSRCDARNRGEGARRRAGGRQRAGGEEEPRASRCARASCANARATFWPPTRSIAGTPARKT